MQLLANKETVTKDIKTLRKELDATLQRVKNTARFLKQAIFQGTDNQVEDHGELIAQTMLAQRDLENSIMRLGMSLKAIGGHNPYPNSYDPSNAIVDKTADGLKL